MGNQITQEYIGKLTKSISDAHYTINEKNKLIELLRAENDKLVESLRIDLHCGRVQSERQEQSIIQLESELVGFRDNSNGGYWTPERRKIASLEMKELCRKGVEQYNKEMAKRKTIWGWILYNKERFVSSKGVTYRA